MISGFRGSWAKYIVGGIIFFIAGVFAVEGVFLGKGGGGMGSGSVAGTVNGEPITLSEFNRAYQQKLEFLKGMMGDKITDEQLKMFRVKENVFQELAQRKLLVQDAERQGLVPSDEQIRRKIMELPYFQKDGKFDQLTYRNLLEANRMSPAQFEKMIREDLLVQEWGRNLESRVQVSEAEARDEYLATKTQRNVKYVTLPAAAAKQGDLAPAELAAKVAPMLKADKSGDAAVNALLKPYNAEVKTTELVSKSSGYLPGLGEQTELQKDVFASPSPIQGQAKVYQTGAQIIVARVIDAKDAEPSQFEKERKSFLNQVRSKKERSLMDASVKRLMDKYKPEANPDVVGADSQEG